MFNAHQDLSIFKAYDIRGIVNYNLHEHTAYAVGAALGTLATRQNLTTFAVARDGRLSSLSLKNALIQGLISTGIDVLDIDLAATPMLYFAATQQALGSGVMITGSHNPPKYNGFKMMLGGITLAGDMIQSLHAQIRANDVIRSDMPGKVTRLDVTNDYIQSIAQHIKLSRPITIAIDAGNGVAGAFAGSLFRALGATVDELFCEVDGTFPNHHPDPAKPENLAALIEHLKHSDAEIGLAFDGDGDRLGVVTKSGTIIYPDRQLMLFARDILQQNQGATVIFDVKSSRLLTPWIENLGGQAIMSKTGHSFIKAAMKENNALLAGEMSGHLFFKDRWFGFDDGLYASARLLEILTRYPDVSEILHALPNSLSTPEINIALPRNCNGHHIIATLANSAQFDGAERYIKIDGLRVEFQDGFGLMRASNTTPVLVLRFEAKNDAALKRIQAAFVGVLKAHPALENLL